MSCKPPDIPTKARPLQEATWTKVQEKRGGSHFSRKFRIEKQLDRTEGSGSAIEESVKRGDEESTESTAAATVASDLANRGWNSYLVPYRKVNSV